MDLPSWPTSLMRFGAIYWFAHLQALGKMDVGSRLLLMQPWCRALAGNLKAR